MPPPSTASPATRTARGPATRQLVLTLWCSPREGFHARAVLADGGVRDFDNPFELVRFLSEPAPPLPPPLPGPEAGGPGPGLR